MFIGISFPRGLGEGEAFGVDDPIGIVIGEGDGEAIGMFIGISIDIGVGDGVGLGVWLCASTCAATRYRSTKSKTI